MTFKPVIPVDPHRMGLWSTTLLLFSLLGPGQTLAEQTPDSDFTVAGQCVLWRTTKPIPAAKVYLLQQRGMLGEARLVGSTETDDQGRFEFTGLQPPSEVRTALVQYTVCCDAKDHAVQFQRIYPHRDASETQIDCYGDQGVLRGRVVDPSGNPIAAATIRTWTGAKLGAGMATTAADGTFELPRLPVAKADQPLKSLMFQVNGPGHPTLFARSEVPAVTEFTLPAGCKLTGSVRHANTAQAVVGAVITALPMKSVNQQEQTLTDENGNFELWVAQGNYHIMLEDSELVAPAIADIECLAGTERELEPMIASPGGWLTGRIIHPRTGDPVVFNDSKQRLIVSSYGPATPKRNVIGGMQMAVVDDDGRFRIRVAPGDNYPYLVNIQAERMGWDTDRQPPIVVPAGGVVRCFIKIKVRLSDEEKMADARQVVEDLPKDTSQRTEAILAEFRKLNHTVDQCELWCSLIKDLVDIGREAVPILCRELDETDEQRMMRRLGFALRAINDPRAVPALIRAIPKTLQPAMSDYGLIVGDAELLKFMQQHDLDADRQGRHFGFGRPIREIFAALNKITGHQLAEQELHNVHRSKDRRTLYRQQQQYQAVAESWRDWWESHYQDFGVDAKYGKVDLQPLPPLDLSSLPTGLRLSENAQIDRSSSGQTLAPIGDQNGNRYFLDVDTGRTIDWPESLSRGDRSASSIEQATAWAAKQGLDLICLPHDDGSEKSPFVLRGIEMQVWEIDPWDAANIGKRIKQGRLPQGRKIDDGLLLHFDPKTNRRFPKIGTSFLYLSREDGLGIITITDFVTQVRDITGMFQAPAGVGYHRGVRFDWKTIAR